MKRVILITGASSGIGNAVAEYLASQGNIVYAGARRYDDIKALNNIPNVRGVILDVTIPDQVKEVVEQIKREQGHLDCLINNAGIMGWGAVIDRDLKYYKSVFDVNLWGAVLMVKECYPLLKKSNNAPVIFNISSQGENYTLPFWSPYMMSKHAIKAFTGSLRRELMPEGISVVGIVPGAFKSNMLNSQKEALEEYERKYSSEFTSKVVKMLGLPIKKKSERGLSPKILGELINKIMNSSKRKARYQPGRKFIPDVILEKMPTFITDKIIAKILN